MCLVARFHLAQALSMVGRGLGGTACRDVRFHLVQALSMVGHDLGGTCRPSAPLLGLHALSMVGRGFVLPTYLVGLSVSGLGLGRLQGTACEPCSE